jgi:two-component system response regulator
VNHLYLIAEDEKDTQILINRAFQKAGLDFPLHFTNDGVETLEYLQGSGRFSNRAEYPFPAILLLDYKMPRLDGLQTLARIRSDPKLKALVVVMLSSSIDEAQILKAYELGANSYVEKPFDLTELIQAVSCINQYWFGCNHFPHVPAGNGVRVLRPQKKHRSLNRT